MFCMVLAICLFIENQVKIPIWPETLASNFGKSYEFLYQINNVLMEDVNEMREHFPFLKSYDVIFYIFYDFINYLAN